MNCLHILKPVSVYDGHSVKIVERSRKVVVSDFLPSLSLTKYLPKLSLPENEITAGGVGNELIYVAVLKLKRPYSATKIVQIPGGMV